MDWLWVDQLLLDNSRALPSDSPLAKTDFPSLRSCQLQIVTNNFLTGVGLCAHFLFSMLGFPVAWTCAGRPCAPCRSLCGYICVSVPLCLGQSIFHHLQLLGFFCLLFRIDPWASRGDDEDTPVRTKGKSGERRGRRMQELVDGKDAAKCSLQDRA